MPAGLCCDCGSRFARRPGNEALIMNLRVAIGEAGPSAAKAWLRALEMTAPIVAHPARTLPHLSLRPALWALGDAGTEFARLDIELERHAVARLDPSERRRVTIDDTALHIYTSGTTGLPKAAKVSHARVMTWSHWFAGMMDTRPDDRMYDCLPLYHSVGGVVATGALLVAGGSVVIRERFSARQFWD